ncbi:MAG TPA: phosphatase PAP2 family protein, partial [Thermoanaerobaculia bacterium]
TPFGAERAIGISALLIAAGSFTNDPRMRDAGRDSLESEVWAAGIVAPVLKRTFGRTRPSQEQGAHSFHPFTSKDESFPSGHATNAFAFASAIAGHYDGWIVPAIVYTMATGVAFSRVNDRAHFPSDVVAGALIGRTVGRSLVSRHRNTRVTLIWTTLPAGSQRTARTK